MKQTLPYHYESTAILNATINKAFTYLDDHRKLSGHMEKSSWMMMGSKMSTELDVNKGQSVGSKIVMKGNMMGVPLRVTEKVTEYLVPTKKVWETYGPQRLIIIDQYKMGFELEPQGNLSQLKVFIDYSLPPTGISHLLGRLLGKAYARWCTESMVQDAESNFRNVPIN